MRLSTDLVANPIKHREDFYALYAGEIDQFGFNVKTIAKWHPFFQFLYEGYFEVRTLGLENIPAEGKAVLVGNHSGVLPVDAFMLYTALLLHHSSPRRIRFLAHKFLLSNPISRPIVSGYGAVPATFEIARQLLEDEELVFLYPEGARGTGKPFSMRYRLCDFDPGFVKEAITTGAPIIPIVTVGGDEIYPLLGNLKPIAHLMNAPYWPALLTFPWLPGYSSCIPLPIKLLIKIGKPIFLNYPSEMASDRKLRLQLTRDIQYLIQKELNSLLHKRKSPFAAWDKSIQ